jgi:hypothetical protein
MQTCGKIEIQVCVFLTSAVAGGECSASRPGRFTHINQWVASQNQSRFRAEGSNFFPLSVIQFRIETCSLMACCFTDLAHLPVPTELSRVY